MTVRGTVLLGVVLALLVAYLVVVPPPATIVGDAARRLCPPLDGATAVEVLRGSVPRRYVRRGEAWEPPAAGDLVQSLAAIEVLGVIDPDPATPESYGFGPDAPRLRVLAGETELAALDVGASNPAGTGVYVRRRGERAVLLVGALLRWELDKLRRVTSMTPQS